MLQNIFLNIAEILFQAIGNFGRGFVFGPVYILIFIPLTPGKGEGIPEENRNQLKQKRTVV